jgi:UDP-3-O-[3-hydroxymyristoyl] glucosamine N-acyltransferase
VIESGCIVEEGARIGNHAHIQAGSIIRRNAKVSSKAQIACGSIITGERSFEE